MKVAARRLQPALIALVLMGALSCSSSGHGKSSSVPRKLSHVAVERYIEGNSLGTDVKCNNGKDFLMRKNGATFTCRADEAKRFTVTITDKKKGDYSVSG